MSRAVVREATTRLLRSLGFIAKGFSSAEEFLKSNRLQITSCLIADVQMPETSRLALYGQLVASGNPIPTILITAYPDDAIRARALSAGVAAYLVKPFSEKDLLDSIDTALKHKVSVAPIDR
jgi:FixJ family two-component response regulator